VRAGNCYFNNRSNWLAHARNSDKYLGLLDGHRRHRPGRPGGWDKIREGRGPWKILDAGAGTCSGSSWLADRGLLSDRLVFNFGYYDCSMAAVCAERGSPIMAWSWSDPLPVCGGCKFDFLSQVGGLHHTSGSCLKEVPFEACAQRAYDRVMDNFDKVLACRGAMWLDDLPSQAPAGHWRWWAHVAKWARRRGYAVTDRSGSDRGRLLLTRVC